MYQRLNLCGCPPQAGFVRGAAHAAMSVSKVARERASRDGLRVEHGIELGCGRVIHGLSVLQ
jgi:hypothetical protein